MVTEPVDAATGEMDTLMIDVVDPASAVDGTLGRKAFLIWQLIRDDEGRPMYQARSLTDGTIYRIRSTETPPPSTAAVMEVTPP
jgi:hypothetical protein